MFGGVIKKPVDREVTAKSVFFCFPKMDGIGASAVGVGPVATKRRHFRWLHGFIIAIANTGQLWQDADHAEGGTES